jgi:hypothetical protein
MNTLLLGTAVDAETGLNVTKQFSLGSIVSLFAQNYPILSELTTTGSSGPATLVDGALNIPNYTSTPGYRSYTVYLTQSGTDDPDVTPLFSDIDGTISITRMGTQGVYNCVISGTDTFTKAWYALTPNTFSVNVGGGVSYLVINKISPTTFRILTYDNGVLADDMLLDTPLEIKIFD